RIEAINRGAKAAPLHVLPTLWFRNTWSWTGRAQSKPHIEPGPSGPGFQSLLSDDSGVDELSTVPVQYSLGRRALLADGPSNGKPVPVLFTDNETNTGRVFGNSFCSPAFTKDAFHRHVIHGEPCLNPARIGTKAAFQYIFPAIPPGGSVTLRLRLADH